MALVLGVSTTAHADDDPELLDRRARAEFAAGQYRQAALDFDAIMLRTPHVNTAYNAAWAWERAGERARAANGYEVAVAAPGLDAERATAAREHLAKLRESLGRVEISAPADARIGLDGEHEALPPLTRWIEPGSHRVMLRRDGAPMQAKEFVVTARHTFTFDFAPASIPVAGPASPPVVVAPKPRATSERSRTPGFVLLAVGGALAAGYAGVAIHYTATRGDYPDNGTSHGALVREFYASWALGLGAAACGAVGAYFMLRPANLPAPRVGVGPGRLTVGVAF